jgi:hypothetical protein
MRTATIAACLLLAGCDQIPGTAAHTERQVREILAPALFDAESARLQSIRPGKLLPDDKKGEALVCGELNAKNRMNAYVGFTRFIASLKSKEAFTDPRFEGNPGTVQEAEGQCRDARANPYSAGFATSVCERADQQANDLSAQIAFDSQWSKRCVE